MHRYSSKMLGLNYNYDNLKLKQDYAKDDKN
jgi:hypothetical protein